MLSVALFSCGFFLLWYLCRCCLIGFFLLCILCVCGVLVVVGLVERFCSSFWGVLRGLLCVLLFLFFFIVVVFFFVFGFRVLGAVFVLVVFFLLF